MKLGNIFSAFVFYVITLSGSAYAHCPLCTIGAGAAAAGAVWLGISKIVVALFIGAFAISMGMWFSNIIKKRYIPLQNALIIIIIFITTTIPLMPIFKVIGPLYLPFGDYGKTLAINYSLISSLFGGALVFLSPSISRKITKTRRKTMPFQGVLITFLLLIIAGTIIQLML